MPQPMPARPTAVPMSLTVAATLGSKPAVTHRLIVSRPSVLSGQRTHASFQSWAIVQLRAPARE
jgi:hypothetical protein